MATNAMMKINLGERCQDQDGGVGRGMCIYYTRFLFCFYSAFRDLALTSFAVTQRSNGGVGAVSHDRWRGGGSVTSVVGRWSMYGRSNPAHTYSTDARWPR
jgi:hypothetical protein